MRLPRHFVLCLLLLLPCATRAEDIGPEQAAALQRQLQDWLAGLLGPSVKLPDLPWQITGEHDHYQLNWPISGLNTPSGSNSVVASLRPLDQGRWSIDNVTAPSAGTFTVTVPDTGDPGVKGPMKIGFAIGSQQVQGTIDPTLSTTSTLHSDIGHLTITTDGPRQHQEQRVDRYVADTSLVPTKDRRINLTMNASVSGWQSAVLVGDGKATAIGIDAMHAHSRVDGVNRDRFADLLLATGNFIGALPPEALSTHDKDKLSPLARAQLRLMIAALQDMVAAVSLEEEFEGLKVEIAGIGGLSMQRFRMGFGGEAPDSRLHVWFDIGLDGLNSPSLPPKVEFYLPRHIQIRPSLSGVQTADLQKLLLDASEEGADASRLTPDVLDMLAHGGVNFGIETLSFDLGPAKVDGTGTLTVAAPGAWNGKAHVSATGLDQLLSQAKDNPDLAQALPVLIMLRGLAKPDGERLVWDIASQGSTITVNGVDLSRLGGDKPKSKPSGHPQKR